MCFPFLPLPPILLRGVQGLHDVWPGELSTPEYGACKVQDPGVDRAAGHQRPKKLPVLTDDLSYRLPEAQTATEAAGKGLLATHSD